MGVETRCDICAIGRTSCHQAHQRPKRQQCDLNAAEQFKRTTDVGFFLVEAVHVCEKLSMFGRSRRPHLVKISARFVGVVNVS